MDEGIINYEYNMMIIENYSIKSATPLKAGKHQLVVETTIPKVGEPGTVKISVDGKSIRTTELKKTVPLAFTASETFDVGADLGSTVSLKYYDRRPFEFSGKILKVSVKLD